MSSSHLSFLHLVQNSVTNDSRVLKETEAVYNKFPCQKLFIAGLHNGNEAVNEEIEGRSIYRCVLLARRLPKDIVSQSIKYSEWRAKILKRYNSQSISIIHCHDLAPLPVAAKLKTLTGAKLIYDAHELETERNGIHGMRKRLSLWTEKKYLNHVDHIITVSPSILEWYQLRYPDKAISLVRNIPKPSESTLNPLLLRELMNIPDNSLLFLYLGGLTKGRGIEVILKAFDHIDVPHHVLFIGSGPLAEQVKGYSQSCSRIHYHPPVSPSDVLAYARGADVGLCLIEDTCLSYRYCLPNKLFECLLSGLPVVASDLPDQARIVRDYQAGWVISPNESELARFLRNIDAQTARELGSGLSDRVSNLRWENEAKVLTDVYGQLLA